MFESLEMIGASASQKEKFSKAANNLLNHCFILKKKDDTRQDYIYIKDNKEEFSLVFDLLGYDIRIDEAIGLISIFNRNGTGRLQFTKFESIMFLILKLLYLEKRNDLSTDGDTVIIAVQDIRDKYNVLKIKNKQKLDKNLEQRTIALFKRFNLIRNLTSDISLGETRIEIFPSIMIAIPNEGITHLYESVKDRLAEYEEGDDDSKGDNIDEETE
ncbi:DUF4194 domain-containing protein [Treponema zioleckii]|uniref:DUF4194 domain-containing protein n=1 Tax=Treponema zioleckii TaxID=331680 RepID=UPI0018D6FA1E|nr:DUF4194 domain-containing protein [Treponema zioleckii]